MKDILYVLGSGSKYNDLEIKYSLMTVQRFVKNVRRIYVIGDLPRRPVDVDFQYIGAKDVGKDKSTCVRAKLVQFAKHETALNDFILMNDDFFFCREVDADAITPTASGTLEEHIASRADKSSRYHMALVNTARTLKAMKLTTRSFETHVPMLMQRDRFLDLVGRVKWDLSPSPLFRSLYGNTFDVEAGRLSDLKISEPVDEKEIRRRIGNRAVFSIGDGSLTSGGKMVKFLHHITHSEEYTPRGL